VGATVIDQEDRLRAALADRYELDREIGAGGMGHVYLAHDRRHDRSVAIKVLRPELAAALGAERFLREIRIEARLQHPHILPLHDSGSVAGFLYYVMPYVEGETLGERIRREKQLAVANAVQIAREVAEALDYAHRHDVVHRDIKPANILLSGDHPIVADFGLARAMSVANRDSLTASGITVGTAEYMSPEQGSGETELDGRTDIYALGCVLYEMLAGQPPFTGRTMQAVMARHLLDSPPRLGIVRPGLPPELEATVTRALAKVPADRYPTAAALANDLGVYGESGPSVGRARARPRPRVLALALAVALVAASAVAGIFHARPARTTPIGVVVLPFDLTGDNPSAATGGYRQLAEALDWIPGLLSIDGKALLGPDASARPVPLSQLLRGAAQLGGRYLVTGAILPAASGVRVSMDLYAVSNGERVIRGVDSTAGVQRDEPIGRLAVQAIAALAERERLDLGARKAAFSSTTSATALGQLLKGQASLWAGDYDGAAAAYRKAIEADSSCGLAYLRLGDVHGWRHDYSAALLTLEAGLRRRPRLEPRWIKLLAARRAFVLGNGEEAIARFQDAVLDDRGDIDAWLGLGESLYHFAGYAGHPAMDALPALERTAQLDSAFVPIYDHLVDLALMAGDPARADRYVRMMTLGDPQRSVREEAIQVRFGPPAARRAALGRLREADRQALSQLIALWVQAAANLPLADTLASYLTGPNRTPDDRRRGAEFRLTILAAQGHWAEAEQEWRKQAGSQPFDAWMIHAYLAGYPAATVVKPMFAWARAKLSSGEIPDFTLAPWDESQQGFQALAHEAVLTGDSADVTDLLARMKSARQATDPSEAMPASLQASLEARLALLAADTARTITLLERGVSRINQAYTWYYPLTSMAPERRLLSQLLEARGAGADAKRWRDSFDGSWSIGDAVFAAHARLSESLTAR
jgi:tetratricopeptide (TPR) repeat protein/TolB-like protein